MLVDYIKKLKDDLVEQFNDKTNIKGICEVIGKQLDDLFLFFEQLRDERSINAAGGKQLDGVGDIVVLSRLEASQMDGTVSASSMTDEQYRKYLIYKVLKNTCSCTYVDIMRAIGMFWDGPPLKYSESFDEPATIIFDLNIEKDIADMATAIPYVKAGGVGLHLNFHKSDKNIAFYGFAYKRTVKTVHECDTPF